MGCGKETKEEVFEIEPDTAVEFRGETLLLSIPQTDENGSGSLILTYKDQKVEVTDFAEWMTTAYGIPISKDEFYVLVQACYSNDWRESHLIKYDGEKLFETDSTGGGVDDISEVSKEQIAISTRTDLFGTYGIKIPMSIQNDLFVKESDVIDFYFGDENERLSLTVKKSFQAKMGEETLDIPEGSMIYPKGYNEKKKEFFFLYDEKECSVIYGLGSEGYGYSIDGIDEFEIFENLPYAG